MAEIVVLCVLVTLVVVMENCGETVAPAATVTEAGTLAAGLLLARVMTAPPLGAAAFSETVFEVVEPPPTTDVGDKFTEATPTGDPLVIVRFEPIVIPL